MKTYTVTVPAYGAQPGETVRVDPADPTVQLNVSAGVLSEDKATDMRRQTMNCPICSETMKRPPKLSSDQELQEHYQDKHAAFQAPAWQPDTEEE